MTAHELARKLLEGPDLPVVHWQSSGGCDDKVEIEDIYMSEPGEEYDSGLDWGIESPFVMIQ